MGGTPVLRLCDAMIIIRAVGFVLLMSDFLFYYLIALRMARSKCVLLFLRQNNGSHSQ